MRTATMIFVPGFGARCRAYADGLPPGWEALQPPVGACGGSVAALGRWLRVELERRPAPARVAGHSMGGALALLAAADRPDLVRDLLLIAPAGLPLTKPLAASVGDFLVQLASGTHRPADVAASVRELLAAPLATRRLIRELRSLDLSDSMRAVAAAGIPVRVVGAAADSLVTVGRCRRMAALLAADYVEVDEPGGHVWPLRRPRELRRALCSQAAGSVG